MILDNRQHLASPEELGELEKLRAKHKDSDIDLQVMARQAGLWWWRGEWRRWEPR